MRKLLLVITSICLVIMLQAQVVSKTVNVVTVGTLSTFLTAHEDSTITNLTVTGSINNFDFYTMAAMKAIKVIDLSQVNCKSIIPDGALMNCSSLTTIYIPSSVTSIGVAAFEGCSSLTYINIPSSVTSIGGRAFRYCGKISAITIPPNVTSIEFGTFGSDSSLTSITIPSSITSIGVAAFDGCTGLASISIPSSVTFIANGLFEGCNSLTAVTLPETITSIGETAFSGCINLTSITLPLAVTFIGKEAFSGCGKLPSITIPSLVDSIGDRAFVGCANLTSFTIPPLVTSIGFQVFGECSRLTSITIPSSVTSIGDEAFLYDSSLTSITIPSSVNYIGGWAFQYCSSLKTINIPPSVTFIGNDAFQYCFKLVSITIPQSVTAIGFGTFSLCFALSTINIPATDTIIYSNAFGGDTSLKAIYAYPILPIDLHYSFSKNIFQGVDTSNCILYVPAGSLDAYKKANQWKAFIHIIEMSGMWTSDSTILLSSVSNSSISIQQPAGNWTASGSVPWLSFNPTSGTASDSLKIIAQANPNDSIRKATFTIKSSTGTKTITVTQAAGTKASSPNIKNEDLTLYPNPTHSTFTINNEGIAKLAIYDLQGNVVLNTTVQAKEAIPVSKFPDGIYIVKIITGMTVVSKRLVVN